MMGGIDIRLPTMAGDQTLEVAVRAVRQSWPIAVFENGDTGEYYPDISKIPFGGLRELFVYHHSDAADLWNQKGAVPETANTMIHLVYDDGLLTVVIDEQNQEMSAIINAVKSSLEERSSCWEY
jgi:hypothetical protein